MGCTLGISELTRAQLSTDTRALPHPYALLLLPFAHFSKSQLHPDTCLGQRLGVKLDCSLFSHPTLFNSVNS